MQFKRLAEYWQKIEATPSRLEMTAILADLFKESTGEEIDELVNLSLGRLRPKYEGVEFSLAEKMMVRAIAIAAKRPSDEVGKIFKQTGDLGTVVEQCFSGKASQKLAVAEVYRRLMALAVDSGQGSQERKINAMAKLLNDVDNLSAKYLVRIPINNLRLGFSEMTVLDGLSWMEKGDKSLRWELERAFNVMADIGLIAKTFKNKGTAGIKTIKAQVGVPIRPQKSERLPSPEKIVEKLKEFGVEAKWDGFRVQIHLDKNKRIQDQENSLFGSAQSKYYVQIFSRNLDNTTAMFPDIAQAVGELKVDSIVLDGEAIGFDPKTGKLLPFQETVQRKRKHGVAAKAKELPLKVFVYDILNLNGKSTIELPFRRRRELLIKVFAGLKPNSLNLAEQEIVKDETKLKELMKYYLAQGLEGVMCKKLDEPYQAGARNFNWVKLKKASSGELVDTIDSIVMGYYFGKGKRTGFGIGAFLIGLPNDKGEIGSIAKIGTGLSDELWREMAVRCKKIQVKNKPEEFVVDKNLYPDIWVKPEIVTEIMADEITKSPIHAFGLALRFPRLVRFRDDKKIDEATSKKELERLFKLQKK
jgi:DNA ligase-1